MNKPVFLKTLISIFIFLAALEIGIRVSDLDLQYLRFNLYYQGVHPDVHQNSKNPELIYELKPNSYMPDAFGLHSKERPNYKSTISINEWGYRFSPWTLEKRPGVFRIVIFGGSNTYGASVGDTDTCSYQLFKVLEKWAPGRFEVWNGGLTASVLSQKVQLARKAVKELNPDLIIFKHFHNTGRRAFFNQDYKISEAAAVKEYFLKNPELYSENVPFLFNDNPTIDRWHAWLVQHWAAYRMVHILINYAFVKFEFPNYASNCLAGDLCRRIFEKYEGYGDYVSERDFQKFLDENKNIKTIMFDPVRQKNCNNENFTFHGLPVLSLCTADMPSEYRDIHPPSYVYAYYGKTIADYLISSGLITRN